MHEGIACHATINGARPPWQRHDELFVVMKSSAVSTMPMVSASPVTIPATERSTAGPVLRLKSRLMMMTKAKRENPLLKIKMQDLS